MTTTRTAGAILACCLSSWVTADDQDSELTGPPEAAESGEISERCLALRDDIDADLGEVMRAGCEPTLAQMSALMDNPIGNVAHGRAGGVANG